MSNFKKNDLQLLSVFSIVLVIIFGIQSCNGQNNCEWKNLTESEWDCSAGMDQCNYLNDTSVCYCYSIYDSGNDNQWNDRKCGGLSRNRCYLKCWKGCRWSCDYC